MFSVRSILLALGFLFLIAAQVQAHFLFLRIVPSEKGSRAAELYFSDRADTGDEQFVDKIAHTKLWVQTKPGDFQPLPLKPSTDRLRAGLPDSPTLAVVGICEYGVLPRKTPFLLRHFPKTMAGDPVDIDKLKTFGKIPLEIVGRVQGDKLHLQVLRDGKPYPKAPIDILTEKLGGKSHVCNDQGRLVWTPPKDGWYQAYTSHFHKTVGEHDGKQYQEIRDFASLSFTWPLKRGK